MGGFQLVPWTSFSDLHQAHKELGVGWGGQEGVEQNATPSLNGCSLDETWMDRT